MNMSYENSMIMKHNFFFIMYMYILKKYIWRFQKLSNSYKWIPSEKSTSRASIHTKHDPASEYKVGIWIKNSVD